MPVIDFSYRKANNWVWREVENLAPIIANVRYMTPEEFLEDSFCLYINGQKIPAADELKGYFIIDSRTFELKYAKRNHWFLTVGYLKK